MSKSESRLDVIAGGSPDSVRFLLKRHGLPRGIEIFKRRVELGDDELTLDDFAAGSRDVRLVERGGQISPLQLAQGSPHTGEGCHPLVRRQRLLKTLGRI